VVVKKKAHPHGGALLSGHNCDHGWAYLGGAWKLIGGLEEYFKQNYTILILTGAVDRVCNGDVGSMKAVNLCTTKETTLITCRKRKNALEIEQAPLRESTTTL
jgi:hypothetical protein